MTDRDPSPTPPRPERPSCAFRLNFEQQKNRAKDLLRAARAGDAQALARFEAIRPIAAARRDSDDFGASPPRGGLKLADAQLVIARELRFASWAKLKAHVERMRRQLDDIDAQAPAPDREMKTLHLRCGSDIRGTLLEAGFVGDFLEHSTPYCQGPVSLGPDRHALMARFIVEGFVDFRPETTYERVLEGCRQDDARLLQSAQDYERVVLWMEHDPYDQLVLARVLAHYADSPRPRLLELVNIDEFPGGARFLGLGQLPPEALRLLWPTRKPVTSAQLAVGREVWNALASDDPRRLASLMRGGTPALPIMAPALHRHLQELPSVGNGLGLCQQIVLEIVAERPSITLNELFSLTIRGRDPLPSIGDWGIARVMKEMEAAAEPPLVRTRSTPEEPIWRNPLSLTDAGRAVLARERDWLDLDPKPRWVGGVLVKPGRGWRWDESRREPVLQGDPSK